MLGCLYREEITQLSALLWSSFLGHLSGEYRGGEDLGEFHAVYWLRGAVGYGFRQEILGIRYKVHEVNPRIGAMSRTFVADNGLDVVRAIQNLTNQPIVSAAVLEGRRWTVEDVDGTSALRYWRDGNLSMRDWLRSGSGIKETAFLCRDDTWPFVGHVCWTPIAH